jgi:hypothetical protein
MATYTKAILSGSTSGKGVLVATTATAGTLIHTAVAGATDFDEIWIYAVNSSSSSVKLTIEYGGATAPDDNIEVTVLPEAGLVTVVAGLLLNGGLTVKAFAGTASVVTVHGFVNQIAA